MVVPPAGALRGAGALPADLPLFVGRRAELLGLTRHLEQLRAGRPQVLLISGEAGVGKSRLLTEFRDRLRGQPGLPIFVGRCYEDLRLPYLPFLETLLPALADPALRDAIAADDAALLKQLVRDPTTTSPAPSDAVADREAFSVRQAVARAMIALGERTPFVFVLEDLHWADDATLGLFAHLVFAIADASVGRPLPVGVVATLRPPAGDGALARAYARIRRERICRLLELEGLDRLSVGQLVRALGIDNSSQQLIDTVAEASGGNPLFVQEIVSHLLSAAASGEGSERGVVSAGPLALPLPAELRSSIAARLDALEPELRDLLVTAACLGERFTMPLLVAISTLGKERVGAGLEQALSHGFLAAGERGYRFAHPMFRNVCYAAAGVERRARLHAAVADQLVARYGAAAEDHAAEIAHHLIAAGGAASEDLTRVWARRAADHAAAVSAWGEAGVFYEAALAASNGRPPAAGPETLELHRRAAHAFDINQDATPCLRHLDALLDAYASADGSLERLAEYGRALVDWYRVQIAYEVPPGSLIDLSRLDELLARLGELEPALRGWLLASKAEAYFRAGQHEEFVRLAAEASELARRAGDDALLARACQTLGVAKLQTLDYVEAAACFEEQAELARRIGDGSRELRGASRLLHALLCLGRLAEVEELGARAWEAALRSGEFADGALVGTALVGAAVARGDFDRAEQLTADTSALISRTDYMDGSRLLLPAIACARSLTGAPEEALHALRLIDDRQPVEVRRIYTLLVRARAGAVPAVRAELAAQPLAGGRATASRATLPALVALVDLAQLLDAPELVRAAVPALEQAGNARGVALASPWVGSVRRALGVAHQLLGHPRRAQQELTRALTEAEACGAASEAARAHLELARALLRAARRPDEQVGTHLAAATEGFDVLGMRPLRAEAERLAATLGRTLPRAAVVRAALPGGLTSRELEVLRALASGMTNDQIADHLVMAPATSRRHVATIFRKLDVSNRAAAATWCVEHGLLEARSLTPAASR